MGKINVCDKIVIEN